MAAGEITTAELSSCDRDCMAPKPKIHSLWPFTENNRQTPDLGHASKHHIALCLMPVLEVSSSSPFLTEHSPLSVVHESKHVQELGTTETHRILPDVVMAVTGDGPKLQSWRSYVWSNEQRGKSTNRTLFQQSEKSRSISVEKSVFSTFILPNATEISSVTNLSFVLAGSK